MLPSQSSRTKWPLSCATLEGSGGNKRHFKLLLSIIPPAFRPPHPSLAEAPSPPSFSPLLSAREKQPLGEGEVTIPSHPHESLTLSISSAALPRCRRDAVGIRRRWKGRLTFRLPRRPPLRASRFPLPRMLSPPRPSPPPPPPPPPRPISSVTFMPQSSATGLLVSYKHHLLHFSPCFFYQFVESRVSWPSIGYRSLL